MATDIISPKKFYEPNEAALLLGLTPATLKRLRLSGQISHFRLAPRCVRFTKEQIDTYLAQSERHAVEALAA